MLTCRHAVKAQNIPVGELPGCCMAFEEGH